MTSIDTLLKAAAPKAVRPDPDVVEADLARGRAALASTRRRRTRRRLAVAGGSLAIAGAAAAIVGVTASTTNPPAGHVRARVTARAGVTRVRLVDYTGTQLPGFTVAQIPAGWHLSSSISDALLITPDGSTNNDPNDFAGKLAVLTSSVDEHGLGPGTPVTVGGQAGRVDSQAGVLVLRYNTPRGFGVDIQAPDALHWTDAQIVAFAEGVQVTANAVHSLG